MQILLPLVYFIVAVPIVDPFAVISIDLGARYVKNGIIRSGHHAEIVYDHEGRNFITTISFASAPPKIGDSARRAILKYPGNTFSLFPGLLSSSSLLDAEHYLKFWKYFHPNASYDQNERTLKDASNSSLQPHFLEECLAMIMQHSMKRSIFFAEKHQIYSIVLQSPLFLGYNERSLLISLAHMMNLNVSAVMPSTLAAAFSYGLFNTIEYQRKHLIIMIIDVGATSTHASLFELSHRKSEDKSSELTPTLITLAHVFDRYVGSMHFQLLIRDMLIAQIKKKVSSFDHNSKTLHKLAIYSEQILKRMTLEKVVRITAESVYEGVDIDFEIKADDLNEAFKPLISRAQSLVQSLLYKANVSVNNIDQVTPIGGGSRIISLEKAICVILNRTQFDRRLNVDEGSLLGSAYYGAALSPYFKTKKFNVKDILTFSVKLKIPTSATNPNETLLNLYDAGNLYPKRRAVTLRNRLDDFNLTVLIQDEHSNIQSTKQSPSFSRVLLISEIKDAQASYPTGTQHLGVKLYFLIDENQQLSVEKIEYRARIPKNEGTFKGIKDRIFKTLGLNKDESNLTSQLTSNDSLSVVNETQTEVNSTIASSDKNEDVASKANKDTRVLDIRHLKFTWLNQFENNKDIRSDRLVEVKRLLDLYEKQETDRLELEKLQNDLEATLYEWDSRLSDEAFLQYIKKTELDILRKAVHEKKEWFDQYGFDSDQQSLREHSIEMSNMTTPIDRRIKELKSLNLSIDNIERIINATNGFLLKSVNVTQENIDSLKRSSINQSGENDSAQLVIPTSVQVKPLLKWEVDMLGSKLNETQTWFSKMLERQRKQKLSDDPVLLSADLDRRSLELLREMEFLSRKVRNFVYPKAPKTNESISHLHTENVTETSANNTSNDTVKVVRNSLDGSKTEKNESERKQSFINKTGKVDKTEL